MTWFILAVAVGCVALTAALLVGLIGGGMGAPTSSLAHEPLPDDRLTDSVISDVRFDVGARGYRMSQVDSVVDRLRRELRERDEEIAVLRAEAGTAASAAAAERLEQDTRRSPEPDAAHLGWPDQP